MSDTTNYFGKSSEVIASALANNPKYDAVWVDEVSRILSTYDGYYEEDFSGLTAEQCALIAQALKQYSDDKQFIDLLLKRNLNLTQMQIVLSARNNGVEKYEWLDQLANEKLHYAKGNYISQAMVEGFNMFDILNPYEYDSDQIYEIFAGFKSNIDYKRYLNPEYPSEKMGIMRHGMQLGLDVKIFEDGLLTIYIA